MATNNQITYFEKLLTSGIITLSQSIQKWHIAIFVRLANLRYDKISNTFMHELIIDVKHLNWKNVYNKNWEYTERIISCIFDKDVERFRAFSSEWNYRRNFIGNYTEKELIESVKTELSKLTEIIKGRLKLNREEVIAFLAHLRPEMTEDDWKEVDLISTLSWAIPHYNAWLEDGFRKMEIEPKHNRHLYGCKRCSRQMWLTTDLFLKAHLRGSCPDCKVKQLKISRFRYRKMKISPTDV